MIGKEKRIALKCKTLHCPNWPLCLEATQGVRSAQLHWGPFASKCKMLYLGGQAVPTTVTGTLAAEVG